jgi:vacuolar-type H+-ATPase subunit C/Vma6
VKLFWPAKEYGLVNTRIRGKKSRFLTVGDFERFLQADDFNEFVKLLEATAYGPIMHEEFPEGVPHPDELAIILSKDLVQVLSILIKSLSGKVRSFLETYMNMFTSENLKSIIRGVHVGLDKDEILRFAVPLNPHQGEEFISLVQADSVIELIARMPYDDVKEILASHIPEYEELDSTAVLEVAIEEWFLSTVKDELDNFPKSDQKRVMEILETRVVLRNALSRLRSLDLKLDSHITEISMIYFTKETDTLTHKMLKSETWDEVLRVLYVQKYRRISKQIHRLYEQKNDLAEVELLIEDYQAQQIKKQLQGFPFHLGIIVGFIYYKFYEVRNIRSIGVGLERGESPDEIRKMIITLL